MKKINQQRYENIDSISALESTIVINRRHSKNEGWKNFLDDVYVNGEVNDEGGRIDRFGSTLVLERFYGEVTLPGSRETSLLSRNSAVNGDHPLGKILSIGGAVDLKAPDYTKGIPEKSNYFKNFLIDLGVIGGVALTSQVFSSILGNNGYGMDISLLIGAGASIGIRGFNASTLTLSSLVGATTILGPEFLGKDYFGMEDIAKLAGFGLAGVGGKLVNAVYERFKK